MGFLDLAVVSPVAVAEFEVRLGSECEERDLVEYGVEPEAADANFEVPGVFGVAIVFVDEEVEVDVFGGVEAEGGEEVEVGGGEVGAGCAEVGYFFGGYCYVCETCGWVLVCVGVEGEGTGWQRGCSRSTWIRSQVNAPRLSFMCEVRFVNAYVTAGTLLAVVRSCLARCCDKLVCAKYLSTALCMVSLYRSVSSSENMPSGMGALPFS